MNLDQYTDKLLRELSDEKLRLAIQSVVFSFTKLKKECERRGIWNDVKTAKVEQTKVDAKK